MIREYLDSLREPEAQLNETRDIKKNLLVDGSPYSQLCSNSLILISFRPYPFKMKLVFFKYLKFLYGFPLSTRNTSLKTMNRIKGPLDVITLKCNKVKINSVTEIYFCFFNLKFTSIIFFA